MKEIKKVSPLIPSQLPEFVREDHPLFVQFMESYYEWMEVEGNTLHSSQNLQNIGDIDDTINEFIRNFKNTYLNSFPEEILADKTKLLKHIKEFYRAKGTEKSFKLLFNVLYESPADFYYPHTNILRSSNGKWNQDRILRVLVTRGNGFDFTSTTIVGKNTNASAYIDEVKAVEIGPYYVYELFMNRSSILGNFNADEIISNEDGVEARISTLISGVDMSMSNSGLNYALDDMIYFNGGSGIRAVGKVSSVGLNGQIQNVEMIDHGINYTIPPSPDDIVIESVNGFGAYLYPTTTAIADMKGYWINDDGKLNSADRIHDGFFYQQFSYVVYVNQSLERYSKILKDLLHPAGLIFFGGYRVNQFIDASMSIPNGYGNITLIFPRQAQEFDVVLPDNYSTTYLRSSTEPSSFPLHGSINDLEKYKLFYTPSSLVPGAPASVACGSNSGYYDTYSNTPVCHHFGDVVVGDWIGWDLLKVSYDPDIHDNQFISDNIIGKRFITNSGTIIKVRKVELPKRKGVTGLMTWFMEIIGSGTVLPSEYISSEDTPSISFNAATINPLSKEDGRYGSINVQSDPRIGNDC